MNISWSKTIVTAGLLLLYVLDGNAAAVDAATKSAAAMRPRNAVVKYLSAVLKTTAKCHKKRNHGPSSPLSVDCNDLAPSGRGGKARAQARRRGRRP
jgi:hypothetical protein